MKAITTHHIHFPHIETQLPYGYFVHVRQNVSERSQFGRSQLPHSQMQEFTCGFVIHRAAFVVFQSVIAHQFEIAL